MPASPSTLLPARPSASAGRSRITLAGAALLAVVRIATAGAEVADARAGIESERIKLTTSDGVSLAAWYYPVAEPEGADAPRNAQPRPVVILLHDLGGSHESVEPLAAGLQSRGFAVVAPDLRGHGASSMPGGRPAVEARLLKKSDFEAMAMTGGGGVRDQATLRGDVESVRNWIRERAGRDAIDSERIFVVGSGLGAAVGAHWTRLDAQWPDLAGGPQGRHVRGLVLVSPAWTTNGFSIAPAIGPEPLGRGLPVLVIGGGQDADGVKIYDQLKRLRPAGWSEKRSGQAVPTTAPKLAEGAIPSLFLRQFDTRLTGDRFAAQTPTEAGGGHPGTIVAGFIDAVTSQEP